MAGIIVAPTDLRKNTQEIVTCFSEAHGWAAEGYGRLFDIYQSKAWQQEYESWESYLRDLVVDCAANGISVSLATLQQRIRDQVRLYIGAGIDQETVLALPARVANSVAKLAEWPRIGTMDYDPAKEGEVLSLAPGVRDAAVRLLGTPEDATDKEVLALIVGHLSESPAMGGLDTIKALTRNGDTTTDIWFQVKVGQRRTAVVGHMTRTSGDNLEYAWSGDVQDRGCPDAILGELARRLNTEVTVHS